MSQQGENLNEVTLISVKIYFKRVFKRHNQSNAKLVLAQNIIFSKLIFIPT